MPTDVGNVKAKKEFLFVCLAPGGEAGHAAWHCRKACMRVRGILFMLLKVVLAAVACAWLTLRLGPWKAIGAWAMIVAIVCSIVALLMRAQLLGKVTIINYLAGFTMPWGYRIGRGNLLPIVLTSWSIWVLLSVAVALSMMPQAPPTDKANSTAIARSGERGIAVMVLLCVAWLIDGAVLLRLIGVAATSANAGNVMRSMPPISLLLLGMIGGSVALVSCSHSSGAVWIAVLIAGGPTLLAGGGYLVFLAVILSAGKNARWN